MAGKYTKQELRQMLSRSAFNIVMEEGIERLTIRKVSTGCGLSDPYIYQCYSDLPEMLDAVFVEIDEYVARLIQKVVKAETASYKTAKDLENVCRKLWQTYWDFLMEDPEKTVFYWRYYQSAYYTKEMMEQRMENFDVLVDFIKKSGKKAKLGDKIDVAVLVSNIIDVTSSSAVKIHLGHIEKGAKTEKTVYQSAFALLFHLLGEEVWDDDFTKEDCSR